MNLQEAIEGALARFGLRSDIEFIECPRCRREWTPKSYMNLNTFEQYDKCPECRGYLPVMIPNPAGEHRCQAQVPMSGKGVYLASDIISEPSSPCGVIEDEVFNVDGTLCCARHKDTLWSRHWLKVCEEREKKKRSADEKQDFKARAGGEL